MSVAAVSGNTDYQKAVKATSDFDTPAAGFVKSEEYKSRPTGQSLAIIKQNNTLIYLVTKLNQKVSDLDEKVDKLNRKLESRKETQTEDLGESLVNLSQRLDKLSLGQKDPGPRKQGSIYVYTDPNKIFKEEYSKEKK